MLFPGVCFLGNSLCENSGGTGEAGRRGGLPEGRWKAPHRADCWNRHLLSMEHMAPQCSGLPGWPVLGSPELYQSPPGHRSSARPYTAGLEERPHRWETLLQDVDTAGHRGSCQTAACKETEFTMADGDGSWLPGSLQWTHTSQTLNKVKTFDNMHLKNSFYLSANKYKWKQFCFYAFLQLAD